MISLWRAWPCPRKGGKNDVNGIQNIRFPEKYANLLAKKKQKTKKKSWIQRLVWWPDLSKQIAKCELHKEMEGEIEVYQVEGLTEKRVWDGL